MQKEKDFVERFKSWQKQSQVLNSRNGSYQKAKAINNSEICILMKKEMNKLLIHQDSKVRTKSRKILDQLEKGY